MISTTLQTHEDIIKNHLPKADVYAFCKVCFNQSKLGAEVHFVHDPLGQALVKPNANPRIHLTISGAKSLITEHISNYSYNRLTTRVHNIYKGSKCILEQYYENDHFICFNKLDKSEVFLVNLSDRTISLYVKDYAMESAKRIQKNLNKKSSNSTNFHFISSVEDILIETPKPKEVILPSSWDDIFAGK